jgi:hypothetical protein
MFAKVLMLLVTAFLGAVVVEVALQVPGTDSMVAVFGAVGFMGWWALWLVPATVRVLTGGGR